MITLGLLKTELPEFLANSSLGSRISNWVFWVQQDILSSHKYWWNRKKTSFSTTSGTAEYFLSSRVNGWDITWMGDTARDGFEIKKQPLEVIYNADATPTDTGDPYWWAPVELAGVQASNTATTSSAVSTSASDTAINVLIRGQVSSKDRFETISLNGTVSATPSSPLTWDADSVHSVTLSADPVGAVTVTIGNVVAVIPPSHTRIQCPRIRLKDVPGSTLTLPYVFDQTPLKLVADGDIVEIPDAGQSAVFEGVLYWGYKNNGDVGLAEKQFQVYQRAKESLRSWSHREVSKVDNKYWPNNFGEEVPFTLPRTVGATIDGQ